MRAAAIVAWWSFKAIWSLPRLDSVRDLAILLGLVAITPWQLHRRGPAVR